MKFSRLLFFFVLIAALLAGCASAPEVYSISYNGTDYTVDTVNGTISDSLYTYLYEVEGTSDRRSTTITYPDGSRYYWTQSSGGGIGGWTDDYAPDRYTDGDTLLAVLEVSAPKEYSGHPFLGLLLIALGLWYTLSPHSAWYLSYGWRYRDAEPSEAALVVARISGIAVILFGIFIIFA